jgi:hypothetical protein
VDLLQAALPGIDKMIGDILQEGLQDDLPVEGPEEEMDKPVHHFWAVKSSSYGGSFIYMCTEEKAKALVMEDPRSQLFTDTSVNGLCRQIDIYHGCADERVTKINRIFGDPAMNDKDEQFIRKFSNVPTWEAHLTAHCNDKSNSGWAYGGFRIELSDQKVLTKQIGLIELMGLMEDVGGEIVVPPDSDSPVIAEINALFTIEQGINPAPSYTIAPNEIVKDHYGFRRNCQGFVVRYLSDAQLAQRAAQKKRTVSQQQAKSAESHMRYINEQLNNLFGKVLQAMLPDWAKPTAYDGYDRYKLLRKLKKWKAIRKSAEYKNLFINWPATPAQLKLMLRAKPRKRKQGNMRVTAKDRKVRAFIIAETLRLK